MHELKTVQNSYDNTEHGMYCMYVLLFFKYTLSVKSFLPNNSKENREKKMCWTLKNILICKHAILLKKKYGKWREKCVGLLEIS